MKISKTSIIVEKTTHYYTAGNPDSNKHLYLFHGYAQNASDFLKEFEYLKDDFFLVSIEGLSAFYAKGLFGNVGYSWMTKNNREEEINDYLKMTNNIITEISNNNKSIYLLGFSQGSQAAARWVNQYRCDMLLMCGGLVPEDCQSINSNTKIIIGNDDSFISQKALREFKTNQNQYNYHDFIGKHEVAHDIVKDILLNHH